jgi:voltage-gated potassium channel
MKPHPFRGIVRKLTDMEPTQFQVLSAAVFLVLLIVSSSFAFASRPGWTLIDGLYMTFITITTIGFQEVRPLGPMGRILTIIIGTVGVVTLGFIVTRTTQLFVTGPTTLKKRHRLRMIGRIDQHYIICGYGRLGQRIARDLDEAGKDFLVIENSDTKLQRLAETDYLFLEGNAEEDRVLREAGIDRAVGVISTLTSDSDNVFVTLLARELNPSLFILARTNSEENARRLYRAGANKVISPYEIGADRMARVILKPNVDRFLERALHISGLDLVIEEVEIREGSAMEGTSLKSSDFRNSYGAIVLGVISADDRAVTFNPSADRTLAAGDVLVIIGDGAMIETVRKGCRSE